MTTLKICKFNDLYRCKLVTLQRSNLNVEMMNEVLVQVFVDQAQLHLFKIVAFPKLLFRMFAKACCSFSRFILIAVEQRSPFVARANRLA